MKNTNVVVLTGRIGQDPELRQTKNGQQQVMFSLAVNEDYKDQNGNEVKQVNWVPCVIYGALAESFAKYKKKGDLIIVQGSLVVRDGEDKDGNKRTYINVRVKENEWVGGKSDSANSTSQVVQSDDNWTSPQSEEYVPYAALDEDIF